VGSFSFEGATVEVFQSPDGQWHVRSAGCEVVDPHLGTATRTLFNPRNHANTRALIDEILSWQESTERAESSNAQGDGWLTAPTRRHG
jgi:hypothetical protein